MSEASRRYDSSRRQSQGRERILDAAVAIARTRGGWDWADISFKDVAAAAGISERTVYRHFPSQRDLHEEMIQRINAQAAISYDGLALEELGDVIRRLFESLSGFQPDPTRSRPSPAAVAMNRERMRALLDATGNDVRRAALLDVLWSPDTYERLATSWRMSTQEAIDTVVWAVDMLAKADPQ